MKKNFVNVLFVLLFFVSACSTAPVVTAVSVPTTTQIAPMSNSAPASPEAHPGVNNANGVLVQFFNNPFASGTPDAIRIDPAIVFSDYGEAPMEGIAYDFSASWSGYIVPPTSDDYIFLVWGDDKVRFTLENEVLVDTWNEPILQEISTKPVSLEAGKSYSFLFQIFDTGGSAGAMLRWRIAGSSQTDVVPTTAFRVPNDMPQTNPPGTRAEHEICVPDLSDPDVQYMSGTPVPADILISGGMEALQKAAISSANIIGGARQSYQVLLIPVGYSDQDINGGQFAQNMNTLQTIVDQLGLNVHFSYLNVALPAEVKAYGDILNIDYDQVSLAIEKVKTANGVNPLHLFMFVVNAEGRGYSSSLDDDTPFIVIATDGYLYISVHEMGHALGLDDGYEDSFYSYGWFTAWDTEFFLPDANGNPMIPANSAWETWLHDHPTKFQLWVVRNNIAADIGQ